MDEGTIFRSKDGRFCAKYKDANGIYKYIYRKNKTEAKLALRQALQARDEGIIPPSKLTVNAVIDMWMEDYAPTVSYSTYLNRRAIVTHHIRPSIGSAKLSTLSQDDLNKLYRSKAQTLAPSTVRRIHIITKAILTEAVRRKYINFNPATDAKLPKSIRGNGGTKVLTPEQFKHLLATVRDDRYELVYVLGATCALRIGETLGLRCEDFDWERGTVTIQRSLWRGKTYPPKTSSSYRTLKLPAVALEALQRHGIQNREGWLIPTSNGTPVYPNNFHVYSWQPTLRKAGIPKTLTYHKLRHAAASLLLNQRIPLPVVSKYLGHSNPAITARVYSHVINGFEDAAARGMDDALN